MGKVEEFRENLLQAGILDPEGTHHEFVSGMHGRKLDFDLIESGTPLYSDWISVNAEYIKQQFDELPEVVLGVANGTNRVAVDTAAELGSGVVGLVTQKDAQTSKIISLPEDAQRTIAEAKPKLLVVTEDVGTTGSNSVQAAVAAQEAGAQNVEVVTTWKRRENLERLDEAGIAYRAIINEALVTYGPEECEAEGFCAYGWELIPRGQ
jgi:orotate phosphoribosyltransferase